MRGRAGAATLLLGAVLLAGCSSDRGASGGPDDPPAPSAAEPTGPPVATDRQVARLLDRRERAVVGDRRAAFASTTSPGPGRRSQLAVFDVLGELPVARFTHVVSSIEPVGRRGRTRVACQVLVRLAGFDRRPVATTHVLDLVPTGDGWRVSRDRLARSGLTAEPWRLPDAAVVRGPGLAVVVDRGTRDQGDRLLALLQEAVVATGSYVRYPLPPEVLVVAPSTSRLLRDAGFEPFEIRRTGAIVTGVADREGARATERMVLAPSLPAGDDQTVRTVLRHELAHLALGSRDDRLPLWVAEGVAEWASWRGQSPVSIALTALEAARDGDGVTRMPADLDFRSPESGTAYGVAWFAMRWLEDQYGAEAPYDLLDRLQATGASSPREVSQVLERGYGVTSDELAARGGELIDSSFP